MSHEHTHVRMHTRAPGLDRGTLCLIFHSIPAAGENGREARSVVRSFSGYIYLILAAALRNQGSWKR